MMTREDHLLVKLSEEVAEVGMIAAKALQFGLDTRPPHTIATNRELLRRELVDVLNIVVMLKVAGIISAITDEEINAKRSQVEFWLGRSIELGRVER